MLRVRIPSAQLDRQLSRRSSMAERRHVSGHHFVGHFETHSTAGVEYMV